MEGQYLLSYTKKLNWSIFWGYHDALRFKKKPAQNTTPFQHLNIKALTSISTISKVGGVRVARSCLSPSIFHHELSVDSSRPPSSIISRDDTSVGRAVVLDTWERLSLSQQTIFLFGDFGDLSVFQEM